MSKALGLPRLTRLHGMTMNDAYIYVTLEQLKETLRRRWSHTSDTAISSASPTTICSLALMIPVSEGGGIRLSTIPVLGCQ